MDLAYFPPLFPTRLACGHNHSAASPTPPLVDSAFTRVHSDPLTAATLSLDVYPPRSILVFFSIYILSGLMHHCLIECVSYSVNASRILLSECFSVTFVRPTFLLFPAVTTYVPAVTICF